MKEIPNYENYLIDEDGNVFSKHTDKYLKIAKNDKDFIQEFKYQYYYLYRRFQLLNFGKYEYSPKLENGQDYISSVADLVNDSNIVDNPVNDAVDTNSDLTNNALIQELKEYAVNEMKQDLASRITKHNKT